MRKKIGGLQLEEEVLALKVVNESLKLPSVKSESKCFF